MSETKPAPDTKLRAHRRARGLSVEAMAKTLGLSKTAYWNIETGQSTTYKRARDIAEKTGLSVEDILSASATSAVAGTPSGGPRPKLGKGTVSKRSTQRQPSTRTKPGPKPSSRQATA